MLVHTQYVLFAHLLNKQLNIFGKNKHCFLVLHCIFLFKVEINFNKDSKEDNKSSYVAVWEAGRTV